MAGCSSSTFHYFLRQCGRQISSSRTFSSSCKHSRGGIVTNFPPSSSLELDAVFTRAQESIFFPNQLRYQDRKLVYRTSKHHLLTAEEPILVPMTTRDALDPNKSTKGKVKLEPKSFYDKPLNKIMIREIIRLAKTRDDWQMVSVFLREYKAAKRTLKQSEVSKLIRAAAARGHYGLIVDMFQKCKETNLYFDTKESAIEVMLSCLKRAYDSGWEEAQVDKACRNADMAVLLMTQPAHAPQGINSGQGNQPEILGCMLALLGTKSAKFQNFKDDNGKILECAQRFLKGWSNAQVVMNKTSTDEANWLLTTWSPAWAGIQLAQQIVQDTKVSEDLGKIYNGVLGPAISQARDVLKATSKTDTAHNYRGLELWNILSAVLKK